MPFQRLTTIALVLVVPACTCQYALPTGLQPDVRFGAHNDRFDVSNLIRRQVKLYKPNLDPQSDEFRRSYKPRHRKKYKQRLQRDENEVPWPKLLNTETGRNILRERIKDKLEDHVNNLANTIIHKIRGMRRSDDFSYHDNMDSGGGDVEEFNTNLRAFAKNHGSKVHSFKNIDFTTRRKKRVEDFEGDKVVEESDTRNDKADDGYDDVRRHDRLQGIVNKLHGSTQSRRTASDPEKEILFHYAFPVDMKIEGFLQAPLS